MGAGRSSDRRRIYKSTSGRASTSALHEDVFVGSSKGIQGNGNGNKQPDEQRYARKRINKQQHNAKGRDTKTSAG